MRPKDCPLKLKEKCTPETARNCDPERRRECENIPEDEPLPACDAVDKGC